MSFFNLRILMVSISSNSSVHGQSKFFNITSVYRFMTLCDDPIRHCEFKSCSWRGVLDTTLCDNPIRHCEFKSHSWWVVLGTTLCDNPITHCEFKSHSWQGVLDTTFGLTITNSHHINFWWHAVLRSPKCINLWRNNGALWIDDLNIWCVNVDCYHLFSIVSQWIVENNWTEI
jgi:hypothetical protein